MSAFDSDLPFVTIDAAHSRDLDDAIHVEAMGGGRHRVSVAVADCAAFVPEGSELDAMARDRGFTVYRREDATEPMLPREFSEGCASLAEGRPCPSVVAVLDLDASLRLSGISVHRAPIRVARRLHHAGAIAEARRGEGHVGSMLRAAFPLAKALLAGRAASGALSAWNPTTGLLTDEEGRLSHVGGLGAAYVVVQELMILANASLAAMLAEAGVPALYRNHRSKGTANRAALAEDARLAADGGIDASFFEKRHAMLLGRADLGTTADGHFALNLPAYGWFTSPLRRYADLVNQRRLLRHCLGEEAAPEDAGPVLEEIAANLNAAYERARDEDSERHKAWLAERAGRVVAAGRSHALDKPAFTMALKAVAAGTDLGEDFIREARERSRQDRLTNKDLWRLFAAEGPRREACLEIAAEHLRARPEHAPGLLNHASHQHGWLVEEEEPSAESAALPPVFVATARLDCPLGREERTARGGQKKAAQQRALAACLIALTGHPVPVEWSEAPEEARPPLPAAASASAGGVGEDAAASNHKGRLNEWTQGNRTPAPVYRTAADGPPHKPSFRSEVLVRLGSGRELRGNGRGSSKKEAEANAAADLLGRFKTASAAA